MEDGCEKPVAYFSKKLNKHQQAYSIIKKEALPLVLAVKHFKAYVASSEKVILYSEMPMLGCFAGVLYYNHMIL